MFHMSAWRATTFNIFDSAPPITIGGCGSSRGFGSQSASWRVKNLPLKVTDSSVQSLRITVSASSTIATRVPGLGNSIP